MTRNRLATFRELQQEIAKCFDEKQANAINRLARQLLATDEKKTIVEIYRVETEVIKTASIELRWLVGIIVGVVLTFTGVVSYGFATLQSRTSELRVVLERTTADREPNWPTAERRDATGAVIQEDDRN